MPDRFKGLSIKQEAYMYKADNAVIMAAGTSSRFAPLSQEKPKGLIEVRGEILVERQIRQLREAGIGEIFLVAGYQKEQFRYLEKKYNVGIIMNEEYLTRNNHASIQAARSVMGNTFVCSADNYFTRNPFESEVDDAYYAAEFAEGETAEWCMTEDDEGYIDSVRVGGSNAWYMMGHTFWTREFSRRFLAILDEVYDLPETRNKFWENIFMEHLDVLKMRIRRYPKDLIFEFDTLDELRQFDSSYVEDTRSAILKDLARRLACTESEITSITAFREENNEAAGFRCTVRGINYEYRYADSLIRRI